MSEQLSQAEREEMFRQMHGQFLNDHAGHIGRQTAALESIRAMLMFLVVLVILGLLFGILSAVGVLSS